MKITLENGKTVELSKESYDALLEASYKINPFRRM